MEAETLRRNRSNSPNPNTQRISRFDIPPQQGSFCSHGHYNPRFAFGTVHHTPTGFPSMQIEVSAKYGSPVDFIYTEQSFFSPWFKAASLAPL